LSRYALLNAYYSLAMEGNSVGALMPLSYVYRK